MQRKRILVVDDDESIRATLSDVLRDEGYEVVTASDGLEALERVRSHEPDVIVLDLVMPVLDGPAFLKEWRSRGSRVRTPVLVMSASRDPLEQVETLAADASLAKPFDLNELLDIVDRLAHSPSA